MKKIRLMIIALVCMLFVSCSIVIEEPEKKPVDNGTKPSVETKVDTSKNLSAYIIDVGQGDSILIKTPKKNYVLIDSGSSKEKDKLINFLDSNNIKDISAVVATHPHEDHIGNLDDVILKYNVQNIYAPKVTSNTKTFDNLMSAVKEKGLKIKTAKAGVSFNIDGVNFQFIAPNSLKYDSVNNYSSVLSVKYNDISFLFMGDAEKLSENEMLKNGYDLKAQVIKIGHHGSTSSSSKKFINAVNPTYAVISCGVNNDYGHPHKETIQMLQDLKIKTYRTDKNGTVVFTTDGKNIKVNLEK